MEESIVDATGSVIDVARTKEFRRDLEALPGHLEMGDRFRPQ